MPLIPQTIQEQLARQIPAQRKRSHLSQTQLAQKVGTSQTAIARLENGFGNPTVDLIQRIVTALDLQLTLYVRPKPKPDTEPAWLKQP